MNKTELAAKMAGITHDSQVKAAAMLNAALAAIGAALAQGEEVSMTPFGKFVVIRKAARTGRNPRAGETIKIPAGRNIKFKPGQGLKEEISAGPDQPETK